MTVHAPNGTAATVPAVRRAIEANGVLVAVAPNETGRTAGVDRDDAGRFTLGNRAAVGAGGNSGRMRELRQAALAAIQPNDLRRIIRRLVDDAAGGDTASSAIVLAYAIGKPRPAESEQSDNGVSEVLAFQYRMMVEPAQRRCRILEERVAELEGLLEGRGQLAEAAREPSDGRSFERGLSEGTGAAPSSLP